MPVKISSCWSYPIKVHFPPTFYYGRLPTYSKLERLIASWTCMNPSSGWIHSGGSAPSYFPLVLSDICCAFLLSCCLLLGGSHHPLTAVLPSPPSTGDWSWLGVFPFTSLFPSSWLNSVSMRTMPSASLLLHSLTFSTPVVFTSVPSLPHSHTLSNVNTKYLHLWNLHLQSLLLWLWLPNVWPLHVSPSIFLLVSQWLSPWLCPYSTWALGWLSEGFSW